MSTRNQLEKETEKANDDKSVDGSARQRLQSEAHGLRDSHGQSSAAARTEQDAKLPGVNHNFEIDHGDDSVPDSKAQRDNLAEATRLVTRDDPANDARAELLRAADQNRVVAVGESHEQPSAIRRLLTEQMGKLAEKGVTHLALEEEDQARLEHFNRTGDQDDLRCYQNQDMKDLLNAAHAAGIKLVGVDKDVSDKAQAARGHDDFEKMLSDTMKERNETMAGGIRKVLSDGGSKVVFLVGSAHLRHGADGQDSVTDRLKANGVKTESLVAPQCNEESEVDNPYNRLARTAGSAKAFSTGDNPSLGHLRVNEEDGWIDYSSVDRILVLPVK